MSGPKIALPEVEMVKKEESIVGHSLWGGKNLCRANVSREDCGGRGGAEVEAAPAGEPGREKETLVPGSARTTGGATFERASRCCV